MARADYEVVEVLADVVFLINLDRGGRSVTNDVNAVVAEVTAAHPGRRIVYRDGMGRWTSSATTGGCSPASRPGRGAGIDGRSREGLR